MARTRCERTDKIDRVFLYTPPQTLCVFEWVCMCIGVLCHMQRYFSYICDGTGVQADWRVSEWVNYLFNVTIKMFLRSCSQHHRHFVGFFNMVPVLHRHGATLLIGLFRETAPFSPLLRHAGDTEDVFSSLIPREDAGGLSREYVLRIPSVS